MATKTSVQVTDKVNEVCEELKRTSLWRIDIPDWVYEYQKLPETGFAFGEWLQFVFLPNKLQGKKNRQSESIVPQAMKFFGNEVSKGRLLQLLVELDSLTD